MWSTMRNDLQFYCCHNLIVQQPVSSPGILEQDKCFCVVIFIFCVVQLSLLFQVTSCPHVPLGVITWPNQMCLHTGFDYLSFPNVSHPNPIVFPPLPACLNCVLLPFFASLSCVFFAAVQPFLFSSYTGFLPQRCQPVPIYRIQFCFSLQLLC